jgi:hypothetical protein
MSARGVKKRQPKKAEVKIDPQMEVAEKIVSSLKRVHMRVPKY